MYYLEIQDSPCISLKTDLEFLGFSKRCHSWWEMVGNWSSIPEFNCECCFCWSLCDHQLSKAVEKGSEFWKGLGICWILGESHWLFQCEPCPVSKERAKHQFQCRNVIFAPGDWVSMCLCVLTNELVSKTNLGENGKNFTLWGHILPVWAGQAEHLPKPKSSLYSS